MPVRTLLIVDDIDTNRIILKKILSGEYNILEASNGSEALEVMRREYRTLSAVLLDLLMPVTDGFEVLRRIGEDARLSQIPVIVTTGASKEDSEVEALKLGCHDYISKPYNSVIIRQRLKNTINLRETAAAVNALQRDALTGLYTRGMFFEKAKEKIARHEAGYYMFSCFDVDNFKVINDQYGAETGDLVLKHIAHCLDRYSYEMGGLCSRVTADNFALIYRNTPENLKTMVKCHHAAVETDLVEGEINIRIGRYVIDDVSLEVSAMYDRAMLAAECVRGMYDNYIALYSESMRSRLLGEQEIVFEMKNALRNGQFETWMQPQYNHATGRIIGAEALARWRHPKKGLMPPDQFIPVFERNGFIYELDKFIWDNVCARLRDWIDAGDEPVRVSVNVSRYDALRGDFFAVITSTLEKYRLPAEMLHLEITESAFAKSDSRLLAVVKRLMEYGFTVEIDDFGSGYSSLNTLKDVHASVLKLDMKFLAGSDDAARGRNIVQSMVSMAKWLGMSVIAEGVETREHADFLKSIGCEYVQGYLYGRPMPASEYAKLARNSPKQRDTHTAVKASTPVQQTLPIILEAIMRSSSDYSFAKDRELRYICTSRAFANMSGVENEADIVGKTDFDIYPREEARKYRADDLRLLESGEPLIDMVEPIPGKDFLPRYSCTSKYPLRDGSGNIIGIFGVGRDITKTRSAFDQLKLVTDTIPGGIATYLVTRDGIKLTYFSENYFAHTGYTKEEYMALAKGDPICLVLREDVSVITEAIGRVFAGENEFYYEYRAKRKDGGVCWLRLQGVVVSRARDSFTANVVKYDISEQKKTEERLRIKNEEMKLALGEMGKAVFVYDIPSRLISPPKSYALSHGLELGCEYVPLDALFALAATESDLSAMKAFFEGLDSGIKRASAQIYAALPSGAIKLESAEGIAVFDDEGKPARAIISVEDITDRRREFDAISAEREYQARLAAEYKRLFTDASTEMYSHIIKIDMNTNDAYKIEFKNGVMRESDLRMKWSAYYADFITRTHPDDRAAVLEKTMGGDLGRVPRGNGVKATYRCRLDDSAGYRWYTTVMRTSSEADAAYIPGVAPKRYATAFTVDVNDDMLERARLTDLSEHDGLTDLFNRLKYAEMLDSRYRNMASCGVMYFDVNFLKRVNDAMGHEAGDALLKTVADSIRSIASRRVHAYRFGGDEFAVIVCDASEGEMDLLMSMWAERLTVLSENRGIKCSVAAGKAWSPAPYDINELLNEADRNMFRDKRRKKTSADAS